jgi:hypothetical protein
VQATSAASNTFTFTNNSAEDPVYVAIAGQEINPINRSIKFGYLQPQTVGGHPDFK